MNKELNEEALQDLYAWVDKIKLSRPKRNISRDFSDGVMAAEVVKHFFPKLVELHNYTPAHSTQQKLINWNTLNRKVFSKLNFHVPADILKKITLSTPGSIEPVLCALRERLECKQAGIVSNGKQDLEYYSTANEKAKTENGRSTIENAYMAAGPVNKTQLYRPPAVPGENVDPAFHLLSEEKDQALLASKEIVEILQMKVNRLEQLVHLKDLQIEEQAKKHEHSVKAYKG